MSTKLPLLVVSDGCGNIFEIPEFYMAGMSLSTPVLPNRTALVELPDGSDLFEMPGRVPIGYDPQTREFVEVQEYQGKPVWAVAAFMPPAYVQYYRSAYQTTPGAPRLPLYSYTALGWRNNRFFVTGVRIDPDARHDPRAFDLDGIHKQAQRMRKRFPHNRLVRHLLENCADCYRCPNARNFVMERWECPAPTSMACNADCVGCISKQSPETGVQASQDRLAFVPTVDEIVEFTVPHLETAPRAIVSFGQGCEGEPLLAGEVITEAIKAIRKRTTRGIINLNTNASRPEIVERLCEAGLDSIRVSLNSAQKALYETYYQPRNYAFEDVLESLRIVGHFQRWVSLNYFVFPGLTDHSTEVAALEKLIEETKINMIQTRNINIDPEWYIETLGLQNLSSDFMGVRSWIAHIKTRFPWIKFGYFNPPREEMKRETL